MFSPLEQFNILALRNMGLNCPIYITNNTIMLVFITIAFIVIFYLHSLYSTFLPSRWQYILENIYIFILNLIRGQITNLLALKYFPIIFFLFNFILASNFLGLLPYGFTITSHIIFTLTIALSVFTGITLINIVNNQFDFLKLFIPIGVPTLLLPFLVIIEFVSYLIRPFSLAVRLFANMLAGHTLLNIMASFVFSCFKSYPLLVFLPLLFVVFVVILEFCIAIVQAYIFTVLIVIYLTDVYQTAH